MCDGWIKLYRGVSENWVWNDKPFSKGQAWLDLIIMANYKDNKFPLGDELVTVERGSFITSEVKLMERWGWSKSKVRLFLNQLQSDEMIVKKSDRKKTTLTIVKYDSYQESETTEEPKKDHEKTTDRPLKDTNKKERKKERNKCIKYYEDNLLNDTFVQYVEFRKKIKSTMTEKAIELAVKKLNDLGKNDEERIAILNQSILNGWKGLFELKQEFKHQQKSNNKFNQFPQRDYSDNDMVSMEQRLLEMR